MKFTVSDFPAKGNELDTAQIIELCRLSEEVGFDRFGVTDFPFHYDCVALMAACLRATERIEVESLVTTPYARLADVAACAWATLADLSAGRAILGIGGGVEAPSKVWVPPWGNRRPHPVQATRELVAICRQMWRGEIPATDGEVLRASGMPLDFVTKPVPVLIAARGPRMLQLAGEIADIVHIASPYLGRVYQRQNIDLITKGAQRAGRSLGEFEIDLSVSLCASSDGDDARRLGKLTTGAAILWMAGADEFARKRTDWQRPPDFAVPDHVVEALATQWDMWSGELMPADVEALITDEILDQFTVAGTPDDCVAPLTSLARDLPEITGFRFKLPPITGAGSYDRFREVIVSAGRVAESLRAIIPAA
jgi:5,10-methylenetetrahydromethanopterin reductase